MKLTCTLAHDKAIAIAVPWTAGGLRVVISLGQRLQRECAGGIVRCTLHATWELRLATGSGGMSAAREAGTRALQQQPTLLLLLLLLHARGLKQASAQLAGAEATNGGGDGVAAVTTKQASMRHCGRTLQAMKPPMAEGMMTASLPPASIRSASPRLMCSAALRLETGCSDAICSGGSSAIATSLRAAWCAPQRCDWERSAPRPEV